MKRDGVRGERQTERERESARTVVCLSQINSFYERKPWYFALIILSLKGEKIRKSNSGEKRNPKMKPFDARDNRKWLPRVLTLQRKILR